MRGKRLINELIIINLTRWRGIMERNSPRRWGRRGIATATPIVIIAIIVVIVLGAWGLGLFGAPDEENDGSGNNGPDVSTPQKSVLLELFVTTTCTACPSAEETLQRMYDKDKYDFHWVTMVMDMNLDANSRSGVFGVTAVPTAVLDGGSDKVLGSKPENLYAAMFDDASKTNAHNLTLNGSIQFFENQVNLTVELKNNDVLAGFNGSVVAYVTEPVSRYKNHVGDPIPFGFLDYALYEFLDLPPASQWSNQTVWKGTNISEDNIAVVVVAFNEGASAQTAITLT